MKSTLGFGLVVLGALLACKSEDKTGTPAATAAPALTPTPAATSAAAPAAPAEGAAAAAPPSEKAPAGAGGGDYPADSIKPIADNCSSASAILASVPKKVVEGWKEGQEWTWATQALLAHQQFSLRDDATSQSMEVKFLQYDQPGDAVALVAHCHDGVTCNKLAAMFRFTVPSAKPQLFCGAKIPGIQGVGGAVVKLTPFGGAESKLPEKDNVIGRCARLHVCSRKQDRSTADDLGLSCQRAPGKFKTDCAKKPTCDAVVACMKE
jgi:hypothetical protein